MREAGFDPPPHLIADGQMKRYAPAGSKRGDLSCWYVLHLDFPPSGGFGSWKSGQKFKWSAKLSRPLTDAEQLALKRQIAADKKKKQRLDVELREKAARVADFLWRKSSDDTATNLYLAKKQIKAHGARMNGDSLAIQVRNNGQLVGLQFIPPAGDKKFLTGTPLEGSYFLIGDQPKADDKLIVCEGFATAASIHEATGLSTFVAFNATNLIHVAKWIRSKLPNAKIIIAADDDRWTSKPVANPGMHYGSQAAIAVNGLLRHPYFKKGFPDRPTDFNDLAKLYGLGEVKQQIEHGEPKEAALPEIIQDQVGFHGDIFWDLLPNHQPGKSPKATIANLREILRRIQAQVRYNVIAKKEEILITGRSYSIDNFDNASLADIVDACNRFEMPIGQLNLFLTKLADLNQYNPVINWIESAPWDGRSRLQEFYATVTAKGEKENPIKRWMKETCIKRWMISAVAAAYRPNGVGARGVLVFQGDQYLGKTQWFKRLAPPELDVLIDGATLKPDDKDSVANVIQKWLVELGELDATLRKADIAQLKSFIPKTQDVLRMPYAQKASRFPRRTVFFASVNPETFLLDSTGNTRFWTTACEAINHTHTIDMQQVWAEVKLTLYDKNEAWYLTAEEMKELNEHNEGFSSGEPIEERLASFYAWPGDPERGSWKTVTSILQETGVDRPTKAELNAASAFIKRHNGNRHKRTNTKKLLWVPNQEPAPLFTPLR